jgi:hypothetical protein
MIGDTAPVIVYKTKKDCTHKVPVTLNETKDQVLSYPAPKDLLAGDELALPIRLKKGFLLDRRGINANTAFTSYTYEAYSGLTSPPSGKELLESIEDTTPFEIIYYCGKRNSYGDLVKELNQKIRAGMKDCEVIYPPH